MKFHFFRILRKLVLTIVGFTIGVCCSLLFYEFVVQELDLNDSYRVILFGIVAVFLSLGFAFSVQIRCITCLTVPEFGGISGRRAIQSFILILVLSGPVDNIGRNGGEFIKLMGCLKDLTINITLAGRDLILAPIQHIVYDLKTEEVDIGQKYNLSQLNDMVQPVLDEVADEGESLDIKSENDYLDNEMGHPKRSQELEIVYKGNSKDSEAERIQKKYRKKIAYRCEDIFSKGTEKCKDIFAEKYDECYEEVTFLLGWLLCWPMKLTFICDVLGVFAQDKVCDMSEVIPDGFGENYVAAKKGLDNFSEKFKVKVDYQGLTKFVNMDKLYENKEDMMEAFERGRRYIEYFLGLLKRLLAFTFLLVIFSALSYNEKYFERLSFDNSYMTRYFHKVDRRRATAGKPSIIPLKTFEKSEFTTVLRVGLKGEELRRFGFRILAVAAQALVVFTIFAFDFAFTRLLRLVERHAEFEIYQEGTHILKFSVQGKGFIAQLLRNILKDINVHKHIDIEYLTKPCLPNPWILSPTYYNRTIILFLILVLICYLEALCARVRHLIANFFYPKRSKLRSVWLYNEALRKRRGQLARMKALALRNADDFRSKVDFNVLMALGESFPRVCGCLRLCSGGQRKCVLCKKSGESWRCPVCHFSFCAECFEDMDGRCLQCLARAELRERMYGEDEEADNLV